MNSFMLGFLEGQSISPALLVAVRRIGEFRGREALYQSSAPQLLETLREAAIIASAESSNRIEGVEAPKERIEALVRHRETPRNRSEQEIAGYREVLTTIHANWMNMPSTPNVVLQLHRDLYQFVPGQGGYWKTVPNQIEERLSDGTVRLRFETVPPHRTASAMEDLHERLNEEWEGGRTDHLLLVGAYVLDFLCIHPFLDGNGRMARLLTLFLLYRAGYGVGRYVSLEQVIEETRESYYDALLASSQGWHESRHSLLPWWEYFLGVAVLTAYRRLDERLSGITSRRGAKQAMVEAAIRRLPERFRYGDIERACPGISRPTIQRAMQRLREAGKIELVSRGRDAEWRKVRK
jgi:Fic family protein